ncbi:GAF domain-containing protein, partial [Lysinibacillus sp. D3C2_S12]|uniref:GAF domain-containing protein n=1 Tax=Lysinibacillus sp. D3C2_S12 TaxID=2941226 RepID=UPI0020BE4F18
EEDWLKTHNKINFDESNDAVMQEVFETKKAILIPNVFEDDRPNHEVCRNFGINGLVMFPLISMCEILGQ